jgi:putative redox protein
MVNINIEYQGDLHCQLVHEPSKTVIGTDAPVDNQGRGESFSPTDLIAAGLGTRVHVVKEMVSSPRRIGRLGVEITLPPNIVEGDLKFLENAALTCPVHKSLHGDVQIDLKMHIGNAV